MRNIARTHQFLICCNVNFIVVFQMQNYSLSQSFKIEVLFYKMSKRSILWCTITYLLSFELATTASLTLNKHLFGLKVIINCLALKVNRTKLCSSICLFAWLMKALRTVDHNLQAIKSKNTVRQRNCTNHFYFLSQFAPNALFCCKFFLLLLDSIRC